MDAARGDLSQIEERVLDVLATYGVTSRSRLCVALSGGRDSMTLLEITHRVSARLECELTAIHVHHGLSAHADDWQAFCGEACAQRGVPLQVRRVDARPRPGESLEEKARTLRYACFSESGADYLLLAHHLDDQCETFLLRLLRGSGLQGLLGMPVSRLLQSASGDVQDGGGRVPVLLRPLLDVTRGQIEAYAAHRGLRWVEDDSNGDTRRARNYLRAEVLPRIAMRFPAYRRNIARALASLTEADAVVSRQTLLDKTNAGTGGLSLEQLRDAGTARALNVLRSYLSDQGCRPPARANLLEAWRQLRDARPDSQVRIVVERGELRRFRDRVVWVESPAPEVPVRTLTWEGEGRLVLGGQRGVLLFVHAQGEGIRAASMTPGRVQVCPAMGIMRLRLEPGRPSRTLKNLFQETSMPPWLRPITPVLRCGGETLWVAGLGYDCRHRAAPGEAGIRVQWISAPPAG